MPASGELCALCALCVHPQQPDRYLRNRYAALSILAMAYSAATVNVVCRLVVSYVPPLLAAVVVAHFRCNSVVAMTVARTHSLALYYTQRHGYQLIS